MKLCYRTLSGFEITEFHLLVCVQHSVGLGFPPLRLTDTSQIPVLSSVVDN